VLTCGSKHDCCDIVALHKLAQQWCNGSGRDVLVVGLRSVHIPHIIFILPEWHAEMSQSLVRTAVGWHCLLTAPCKQCL
jgi:hypothetical protein